MYGYNGFNPNMYGYQPNRMQPMEQPTNRLNGKPVESVDVVRAMDIPMDGSINYFPIADGSAIVTKQFMSDGTTRTLVYETTEKPKEVVKYMTKDDLEELQETVDKLKDEIKELKKKKKDE